MHHVAVLYDIVFSLKAELSRIARACFAVSRNVIIVSDGLGADETMLEIGMDDAGGFGRPRAPGHGPGARFLGPRREKRQQAEKRVPGPDQPVQAGFFKAETRKKFRALAFGELRDFLFDAGRNRHDTWALARGPLPGGVRKTAVRRRNGA